MFRFEHIEYLWGLLLILPMVGLFIFLTTWKKRKIKLLGDTGLVKQITGEHSAFKFRVKFFLFLFSLIILIAAAANFQKETEGESISKTGVDVMVLLDVSKSMMAQDIQPNRLERAKQFVMHLLDKLDNNRVGLIYFAGRAYMQMPLSTDFSAANIYLSTASPAAVPTQGTVIGEALRMASNSFNVQEKKFKTVILITDGEDHDEGAMAAAKELAENGAVIHTIGVGSPEGIQLMDPDTGLPKTDENGDPVISKLNEDELKQIAATGNGTYRLLSSTEGTAASIATSVNSMEQRRVSDKSLANWKSYFPLFLAAAFLLLVMEALISERKKIAIA